MSADVRRAFAVIRIRGKVNVKPDLKETMRLLRLNQVNHCVVVPAEPSTEGMLKKVQAYITWGEVSPALVSRLLVSRGRLEGNRPVTEEWVKENTTYGSLSDLSKDLAAGKERMTRLKGLKPLFRLPPPKGGWGGIKRGTKVGGALGYRSAEAMEELIGSMLWEGEAP